MRAKALVAHAKHMPDGTEDKAMLRSDILRSAWMFTVGALDAYFCDAYTWVVGGTLIAKDREKSIVLPNKLLDISLPVAAYLEHYQSRQRWRWRMAARRMMDDKNMLNLSAVEKTFKPFLPATHKIYHDVVIAWLTACPAKNRVFGITRTVFTSQSRKQLNADRQKFIDAMRERFDDVIFQRRHDCIHNCDRPKISPQRMDRAGTVLNVVRDVEFLAARFNDHLDQYFPEFLRSLGFTPATIQAATQ